jgi:membrane protein YqaA with SNARE-associated domain
MAMPDWLKHVLGGGVTVGGTWYFMDKFLKKNPRLDEQRKKVLFSTTVGAVSGGAAGYYLGEKVIDGKIPDCKKRRVIGTLVGAAGGGLAGYFIGRRAVRDAPHSYDKSIDEAIKYEKNNGGR